MEGTTWTNERLDDLAESMRTGFARVDQNFARVDQDLRDLRGELHTEISGVRSEIGGIRGEMQEGFASLRNEIDALRLTTVRVAGVGFFGVIAAILARGA